MPEEINLPAIHGDSNADKIGDTARYLYQLAETLNYNFNDIDRRISDVEKNESVRGNDGIQFPRVDEPLIVTATYGWSTDRKIGNFSVNLETIYNAIVRGRDIFIDVTWLHTPLYYSSHGVKVRFVRQKDRNDPFATESVFCATSDVTNVSYESFPSAYGNAYFYIDVNVSSVGEIPRLSLFHSWEIQDYQLLSETDREKLDSVSPDAEENVIESVSLNGTALPVSGKNVDIQIEPTVAITNAEIDEICV